jgi:hypothetical protein
MVVGEELGVAASRVVGRDGTAIENLRASRAFWRRLDVMMAITSRCGCGVLCSGASFRWNEGDEMRKGYVLLIAGLVCLGGCNVDPGTKTLDVPEKAKSKPPYHLDFETKVSKPTPAGLSIPAVSYTGNPKALEKRASLVVKFDGAGVKNDQPGKDRLVLDPVDIPGTGGTLPQNYMDQADVKVGKLLDGYCYKGTAKLSLALVRSSIKPGATDADIDAKRLSDWLPVEVVFKNPNAHPRC